MTPFKALSTSIFVLTSFLIVQANGDRQPPGFVGVLPSEIKWRPESAVPGAQTAVLIGDPDKPVLTVLRVKLPPNVKVMPHTHPVARTYTVLAGEWKLGFGEKFEPEKLRSFPTGSVYHFPATVPHFQATGSQETIVQIEFVGPTRTDFLNPADAPRR
jgi:quercetin dioxygenase-like cupin family protein